MAPAKPGESEAKEKGLLWANGSRKLESFSAFLTSLGEAEGEELDRLTSRAINAAIVLGVGTFAITKLFTIDYEYWHVTDLTLSYIDF